MPTPEDIEALLVALNVCLKRAEQAEKERDLYRHALEQYAKGEFAGTLFRRSVLRWFHSPDLARTALERGKKIRGEK
jgi:hypothetical protein